MIKSTKKIIAIIFAIMAVIFVLISLVNVVISLFEEKDILTLDETILYTISKNDVKNYNTYYRIEACIENIIEGCKRNEYNAIYKLYMKEYRKGQSKSDIISDLKQAFEINGEISYITKGMYSIDNHGILAIININGQDVNVLFTLNQRSGAAYNFALIK